ncbi:MAG TPA: HAD-IA family hydrolase [Candidatus Saccharimonadia bacterium]|nr:HAD-IA family hydrolase [Candidatus Saccharimonadia bacterium]
MNIIALVIDFSRVLIFTKTADVASLNRHHAELEATPGYRVGEHFYLNIELLEYLRGLSAYVPTYLFTSGGLHALPEFAPALEGIFRDIITTDEIGYGKTKPEAYLALAYRLSYTPSQILFIDDSPANIQAAKTAGFVAVQYQSNAATIKLLDSARR